MESQREEDRKREDKPDREIKRGRIMTPIGSSMRNIRSFKYTIFRKMCYYI